MWQKLGNPVPKHKRITSFSSPCEHKEKEDELLPRVRVSNPPHLRRRSLSSTHLLRCPYLPPPLSSVAFLHLPPKDRAAPPELVPDRLTGRGRASRQTAPVGLPRPRPNPAGRSHPFPPAAPVPNPFPPAAPAPIYSSSRRTTGCRRSSSKRRQELKCDDRPPQLDQELHHEEQELALPRLLSYFAGHLSIVCTAALSRSLETHIGTRRRFMIHAQRRLQPN